MKPSERDDRIREVLDALWFNGYFVVSADLNSQLKVATKATEEVTAIYRDYILGLDCMAEEEQPVLYYDKVEQDNVREYQTEGMAARNDLRQQLKKELE